MRKRIIMAAIALGVVLAFGATGSFAQTLTWDEPYGPLSPKLKELSANGGLYGISEADAVVAVTLSDTVSGTAAVGASITAPTDLVTTAKGTIFVTDGASVGTWTSPDAYATLDPQPNIPEGSVGTYKHVAYGEGGKLFVLFEDISTTNQYMLVGHEINSGLTATMEPRTLNLDSKGSYVNCKITLPAGYSPEDIDVNTVKITRIVIASESVDETVEIFRAPGAPANANSKRLNLKFIRYDKADPSNTQSLIAVLDGLLPDSPEKKATYDVTATIEAEISTTGERFEGNTYFKAVVPKSKKKK